MTWPKTIEELYNPPAGLNEYDEEEESEPEEDKQCSECDSYCCVATLGTGRCCTCDEKG